ncbi:MAG: hypothetical protein DID89_2727547645 [Candidatus Nitrotoga sp. CP45]|nr:MAG: hypothetical protein DID89_2727547645 [Candidatus Nitrotoga sp. CP45]
MTVKQYESAPDTLDIRELEVGGKTLVTTATPQTYPLLIKTRDLAREQVMKYGHPKKLK